ncbi:MAG: PTS sugar transporter subunit IIB [Deltaproteobacteria bacterium]|nr:PTS sugar transporter subunit IIB [Candidatus Anaeroferrophillacea bacterium]
MDHLLLRVDDRLVHGQVVEAWVPRLAITHLVVVDDEVDADPLRRRITTMAAPPGVDIAITSITDAPALLDRLTARAENHVLVLVSRVTDACRLIRADGGRHVDQLNLGNIHYESDRTRISDSVFLTPREIADLEHLAAGGIAVFVQSIPRLPRRSLAEAVHSRRRRGGDYR